MRRDRSDAGFSTVMALGLIVVILAVGGVMATLVAVSATRHRAEAIADLAALAAAQHSLEGPDAACGVARRLARAQQGVLLECLLDGFDAVVLVGVAPPGRAASFGLVKGRARAGRR